MTDVSRAPRPRADGALPDGLARTSGWRARRSSTGPSRATTAAPSCFRIEDTDAARNTQESYDAAARRRCAGSASTGTRAPRSAARTRRTASPSASTSTPTPWPGSRSPSRTYDCYCTNEEVEARRKASRLQDQGYDGHCRELTDEQVAAFEAEGRQPVVRFRMPDGEITFDDLVRGEITFQHRARARLRAGARQRRPALHAGQPGRRRADGDHPRAARRGPALLHPAPDRALRRARGDRHRASAPRGSGTCPT